MLLRTPLATLNNTPSPSKPPGSTIILLHSASWNLFFENLFFLQTLWDVFLSKATMFNSGGEGRRKVDFGRR